VQDAAALSAAEIRAASSRIAGHVFRTPLVPSAHLSELTGGRVYLKLENQQVLGVFKIRGMANRALTLTAKERELGIIVASSGNHAAAASYAGRRWGFAVKVFVPETTPAAKIAKIRRFGAELVLTGRDYDEARAAALDRVGARGGQVWVDPCADPFVIAGHGTIGYEIAEDLRTVSAADAGAGPELARAQAGPDAVLVPVGGGGLVTGIGLALRDCSPGTRVIGVQSEACPALRASLDEGVCHLAYPSAPSLCDALVGGIGETVFELAGRCLDGVVLAGERAISRAVLDLIRYEQVLAEPSGAVGVAYLSGHPEEFAGQTVVIVISGGNLDYPVLDALVRAAEPAAVRRPGRESPAGGPGAGFRR